MISPVQHKLMLRWASNKPMGGGKRINISKVFEIGDSLKNSKKGKKLAILTPSYIMRKIDYAKLIDSSNIDTMTVNKGNFLENSENCDFYLPFTTHGKTMVQNKNLEYVKWLRNFKGLVMHGIHIPDPPSPYILATVPELQYIIKECPQTKIIAWRHLWGRYLETGPRITRMSEFPYFKEWTPSKIPWGHCGAISGFAIPLAMALGYKEIYVVGMGYEYISNDYHTGHQKPLIHHKTRPGSWLQVAPARFKNQAKVAKANKIKLAIGPTSVTEPKLLQFFDGFKRLEDII